MEAPSGAAVPAGDQAASEDADSGARASCGASEPRVSGHTPLGASSRPRASTVMDYGAQRSLTVSSAASYVPRRVRPAAVVWSRRRVLPPRRRRSLTARACFLRHPLRPPPLAAAGVAALQRRGATPAPLFSAAAGAAPLRRRQRLQPPHALDGQPLGGRAVGDVTNPEQGTAAGRESEGASAGRMRLRGCPKRFARLERRMKRSSSATPWGAPPASPAHA
jgi:hypothetical protein